jgi:DNA processing protein
MEGAERAAWLRLALTPAITPATARALLGAIGLPAAIFERQTPYARLVHIAGEAAAACLRGPAAPEIADAIARTNAWLDGGQNRSLVTLADADYPRTLLELADAPILLYAHGRRERLGLPALAIVGSRSATRQGEQNAIAFAAHLGNAGLCIVSGMASGIDAAAHKGALETAAGTIAVLGTGIDVAYPASNRALAGTIARDGLLLSEYSVGTQALPYHFPRRNRLIAALGHGVLVVEAAVQSGSLITARLAGELGREVFAIPGSIHSPQARGCHRLIRDGAKLVESAQDVLEELRTQLRVDLNWGGAAMAPAVAMPGTKELTAADISAEHGALLAALGHDPVDIDALARRLGRDAGAVAAALLELELAQQVERLAGNRYQRLQ